MFHAIKQDGYALEFASKELQSEKEVVLQAVMQNRGAFEYASDVLKKEIKKK